MHIRIAFCGNAHLPESDPTSDGFSPSRRQCLIAPIALWIGPEQSHSVSAPRLNHALYSVAA
jgi:hypothetical protein